VRSLNTDEAELWAQVAATIRPLSREKRVTLEFEKGSRVARTPKPLKAVSARPAKALPQPVAVPMVARTLDGNWGQEAAVWLVEPDRVLDLHGTNPTRPGAAIDSSLEQRLLGQQVVLLITVTIAPAIHRSSAVAYGLPSMTGLRPRDTPPA
jgi:hypothetical protein